MKLPVLSRFNFGAKSATLADRLNILNWLGFGARSATVAVTDAGGGVGQIDIQVLDANGDPVAESTVVEVFVGGSDGSIDDLGILAASTGSIVLDITVDAHALIATDATGAAVLTMTTAAGDDVFAAVKLGNTLVKDDATVAAP